jgi:Zn-dependent protease
MPPGTFGYALPAGRLFGIPISVSWTLLLLLAGITIPDLIRSGPSSALLSLCVGLVIVVSVLIHELAHALTGHRLGHPTRSIELHAFGGVAQLGGSGWIAPRHDLLISLAGPLANFALYALLSGLAAPAGPSIGSVLATAAHWNLAIGLFNLIPCFPMDGGRALLSTLRLRMGAVRGDRLAYTVGLWISVPGMIFGIATSSVLISLIFYIAFDRCRTMRAQIDASFGTGTVVRPFESPDDQHSPGIVETLRSLFSRSREARPPKLRVIKGGRFEDPPDRRSGRLN